jgi:hypothetical protein
VTVEIKQFHQLLAPCQNLFPASGTTPEYDRHQRFWFIGIVGVIACFPQGSCLAHNGIPDNNFGFAYYPMTEPSSLEMRKLECDLRQIRTFSGL